MTAGGLLTLPILSACSSRKTANQDVIARQANDDIAVGLSAPSHTPSGDMNVYLLLLLRRFSTSFSPIVVVFFRPRLDLTSYFLSDDTASAVYPPTLRQCGSDQR